MSHSHLHLMLQEGINLLRSGDLVQAESIFAGILKSNPNEIHSLHLLGVTLCEMGRIKEGISLIEHSIDLDSSRFSPFFNLGKFLFQDSQYTYALSALKKAIEKDPSSFDAWHLLAKTYFYIDDLSNAIKSAKKAASFRSDDANILFLLGFYTSIIDKSSAIAYYELCISFNPSFLQAYVNIADLHFDLNAYENAYINYQKALELNFDCFQALMGIVRIYAHRLQWDECYKFAKQAYQIEPTSSQSSFLFATSLYQLNRPNEACKYFIKLLILIQIRRELISSLHVL